MLAGSMLRNLFGSHVPSDLLLLEDAQIIHIYMNILVNWQYAALRISREECLRSQYVITTDRKGVILGRNHFVNLTHKLTGVILSQSSMLRQFY